MRTTAIIGTDWAGPNPAWIRQPLSPTFDRMLRFDWDNLLDELVGHAHVDGLAVGYRGGNDTNAIACFPVAREAFEAWTGRPFTIMPFIDTVGLPDLTQPQPFDFANDQHIELGWQQFVKLFFDAFVRDANAFAPAPIRIETSPAGKAVILWWGIESQTGHGFINQAQAQCLLDRVSEELTIPSLGLHGADNIVDQSWLTLCPTLQCYAAHNWFNPWGSIPEAYSIRTHRGVTTGVTVPSFYHLIEPQGGEVLRRSLRAMRQAKADYVFMESGTNFHEAAELMRDSTGDTSKLDAIAEHIALVTAPNIGGTMSDATFCISKSQSFAVENGFATYYPKGQTETILSIQSDGKKETRLKAQAGAWETWRPSADDMRAVFYETAEVYAYPLVP